MDENTSADAPAPAPANGAESKAKAAPKPKKKHKVKAKATKPAKAVTAPAAPKATAAGPSSAVLIAIYVVLGLLVIGTSFYTGYLVGKNSDGTGVGGRDNEGAFAGEGTVQIIEYSDYECPFCGRVEPTVAQIKQNYGDRVELIYKHYPLESIHPNALNAAIAAECARNQGEDEFWTYHEKLFQNQDSLDVASLKQYAADTGLNTGKFNTCLDSKETEPKVRADMQEAEGRGVQGTPSFWIKDELVVGALPYDTFKAKIDEKLSGKAPAPAPVPTAPTPQQPAARVEVAAGNNIMGEADAPVLIVEFTDYQCPFCKRYYTQTETQLIKEYVATGKARYAVRHFPLSFHQNAQKAAEAAECAGAQGKFFDMHKVLFEKGNGDGTGLDVASLKQYAADLKLDTKKFNTCLDNGETAAKVQKDFTEGQAAGVSGTPSFFINGKPIVGAQPFTNFKAAIDAELTT